MRQQGATPAAIRGLPASVSRWERIERPQAGAGPLVADGDRPAGRAAQRFLGFVGRIAQGNCRAISPDEVYPRGGIREITPYVLAVRKEERALAEAVGRPGGRGNDHV